MTIFNKYIVSITALLSFFHAQSQFGIIEGRCTMADIPRAKELFSPELQELHDTFCADPKYYGFILRGDPKKDLVEEFTERFQKATYAFNKMQLKAPLNGVEQSFCYNIIDYLDDPLCHDFMLRIKDAPEGTKHLEMDEYQSILADRFLFTHLYLHKAKERYEELGLNEEIKKRTLDLIWQRRYIFATVLHDPMLDNLINKLPESAELSIKLQEMLFDRLLEVRLRLQDWNLLEYVHYQPVERALYDLNDFCRTNPEPYAVVDFLSCYHSDQEDLHVYKVLFTENHVSRCLVHDLELLQDIEVAWQIGYKKNITLRMMYEKLLLTVWEDEEQRTRVRYWLQLIMQACRSGATKSEQRALVEYVRNEL